MYAWKTVWEAAYQATIENDDVAKAATFISVRALHRFVWRQYHHQLSDQPFMLNVPQLVADCWELAARELQRAAEEGSATLASRFDVPALPASKFEVLATPASIFKKTVFADAIATMGANPESEELTLTAPYAFKEVTSSAGGDHESRANQLAALDEVSEVWAESLEHKTKAQDCMLVHHITYALAPAMAGVVDWEARVQVRALVMRAVGKVDIPTQPIWKVRGSPGPLCWSFIVRQTPTGRVIESELRIINSWATQRPLHPEDYSRAEAYETLLTRLEAGAGLVGLLLKHPNHFYADFPPDQYHSTAFPIRLDSLPTGAIAGELRKVRRLKQLVKLAALGRNWELTKECFDPRLTDEMLEQGGRSLLTQYQESQGRISRLDLLQADGYSLQLQCGSGKFQVVSARVRLRKHSI